MEKNKSLAWLRARAVIAGDLFKEGKITRSECFRMEMDVVMGEDSGAMKLKSNADFKDGVM